MFGINSYINNIKHTAMYSFFKNYKDIFLALLILISKMAMSVVYAGDNTASHYLFPVFSKGVVVMKSGNMDAKLNYNTVTEEMVFEQEGQNMAIGNIESIDTVIIQNRKFVPVGKVFYELLVNGQVTLYFQHKGKLVETKTNSPALGASSETASNVSYSTLLTTSGIYGLKLPADYTVIDMSTYRLMVNGKLSTFSNKKQLLKILPDQSTLLDKFISDNKLDINKLDQLIKLIDYCNELYK